MFLIDPADRMNRFAQNALLKTLEEPSGRVVLMLIASRPHLLLPTVRSRCFALRFGALRTVELAGLLQQRGIERAEALERASLAGGLPGKALAVDLDSLRERRGEILAVLESLAGDPTAAAELSPMAARIAGKDERTLVEGLDLLESLLRDAARAGERSPDAALIHADLADRLAELGARLGPQRAAALVRSAERLRRDLRFNLNRVLIAEGLLAAAAGGPLP